MSDDELVKDIKAKLEALNQAILTACKSGLKVYVDYDIVRSMEGDWPVIHLEVYRELYSNRD